MAASMLCKVGFALLVVALRTHAQPYGGVPATVPGTIQAELFDLGGAGVGYSDTTPGNDPEDYFRPGEDVDIERLVTGGYNIGRIRAGEYLRYTVDVTTDVPSFVFTFRVSSETDTGSLRVVSGGTGCDDYKTDLSGLVSVPDTGAYNSYKDVIVSGIGGLAAGITTIWLCMASSDFNIDYFVIT